MFFLYMLFVQYSFCMKTVLAVCTSTRFYEDTLSSSRELASILYVLCRDPTMLQYLPPP
jgi:hypothetical protein